MAGVFHLLGVGGSLDRVVAENADGEVVVSPHHARENLHAGNRKKDVFSDRLSTWETLTHLI